MNNSPKENTTGTEKTKDFLAALAELMRKYELRFRAHVVCDAGDGDGVMLEVWDDEWQSRTLTISNADGGEFGDVIFTAAAIDGLLEQWGNN